jgi:tetratricopeptide (TPR) repeat protein
MLASVVLGSSGCATSPVVKKSAKELAALEQTVELGREKFFKADFDRARGIIASCATEQHVNQPLYKCELASVDLLGGNKEAAEAELKEAVRLLEVFYDQAGEKRAASLWGHESGKVYKGDPYERATLYTLYGMALLEKGEVDNALASFKRALLMDGDTEKSQYQSDFGLVLFLAAKCHDLRGEAEQRDAMLRMACEAYLSQPGVADGFARAVRRDHELARLAQGGQARPPSPLLTTLCAWGGVDALAQRFDFSKEIKAWLAASVPADKGMGFNTLVVGWDGRGPFMSRAGEYGEKRIIHAGYKIGDFRQAYACCVKPTGAFEDGYPWLGNVSYQAATRGGRKMDNVLENKAAFKGTANTAGNAMVIGGAAGMAAFSNNSSSDPYTSLVFAGIMLGGFIFKGFSYMTKAEADIRCWQCLPDEFFVTPLTLPEGETEIAMSCWVFSAPIAARTVKVARRAGAPVTFVHLPTPRMADGAEFYPGYFDGKGSAANLLALYVADPATVDPDGDGEVTAAERERATAEIARRYDADGSGKLDQNEQRRLNAVAEVALKKRMGLLQGVRP